MGNQTELSLSFSIPKQLVDKVQISDLYRNYSAKGYPTSFGVDLEFPELHLSKSLKSSDVHLLPGKIEETLHSWEKKYNTHLDKMHKEKRAESVDEMNREAKEALDALDNILAQTLSINDAVDWDTIKRKDAFRIDPEELVESIEKLNSVHYRTFIDFNSYGRPTGYQEEEYPSKPTLEKVKNEYGFFSKLFRAAAIEEDFRKRLAEWKQQCMRIKKGNSDREAIYNKTLSNFELKKEGFEEEKKSDNEAVEHMKSRYNNSEPKAIEEYCDLMLNNSKYPDYFPKNWTLEYREESRIVLVDYDLPAPD